MQRYIVKRCMQCLITLFGITIVVFFMARMTGDPAIILLPADATDEAIEAFRVKLGLDQPLPVQYLFFIENAVKGDFGLSIAKKEPAMGIILERFPATAVLCLVALLFAVIIALPIGVMSAVKKGSAFDQFGKLLALTGQSMPSFWLGLMLMLVFALYLGFFPTSGFEKPQSIVLPAFTIGWFIAAQIMRIARSSTLNTLDSEYVKLVRIKGLSEKLVIWKHILKNAAIPIVTITGLQIANFLRGSVIVETVFAWPGVGRAAIQAVYQRDFPVVQTSVFFMGVVFVGVNLLVDVIYAFLDPRIRYQ